LVEILRMRDRISSLVCRSSLSMSSIPLFETGFDFSRAGSTEYGHNLLMR
jgi:hypothetical protein